MPHESARPGEIPAVSFREAATGTIIWSVPADRPRDVGRAAMADLSALWPGAESWGPDRFLRDISGKTVGPAPRTPANFLIWWDGDAQREILNSNWIADYDPDSEDGMRRVFTAEGFTSTNGSKSTPVLSADLIGDWREELLLLSRDGQSLRLFISPIPTGIRFPCLMLDPLYRNSIAWQNVGYNQPPHPGRDLSTPIP
jgi:rhamnogalacturonan endolyase